MKPKMKYIIGTILGTAISGVLVWQLFIQSISPLTWREGDKQVYDFLSKTSVKNIDFSTRRTSFYQQVIEGRLNLRVLDVNCDGVTCALQLSQVAVNELGKRNNKLEKLYSTLFTVTFSKAGEIVDYHFDNSIAEKDETAIINMLTFFQAIVPESTGKTWQRVEHDALGTFIADYKAKKEKIIKTKREYTEMTDRNYQDYADKLDLSITNSVIKVDYTKNTSWLQTVDGHEKIVTRIKGKDKKKPAMAVVSEQKGILKLLDVKPDANLAICNHDLTIQTLHHSFKQGNKNPFSYWERRQKGAQLARLSGETIKTLTGAIISGKSIVEIRTALYRLKDYLMLDPEKAREIPQLLNSPAMTKGAAAAIINALALCGNDEAQNALAVIAEDAGQNHAYRISAVTALSDLKQPGPEIVDRMLQLSIQRDNTGAIEISNATLLSIGSLSAKCKEKAIQDQVNTHLEERLTQSTSTNETAMVISAIGNSENSSHASIVTGYVNHDDPSIRASAAYAAEHLNSTQLLNAVTRQLENEPVASVRQTIVETLIKQPANEHTIGAVQRSVFTESSKKTRLAMYRYLYKNSKGTTATRDIFENRMRSESSRANRAYLVKALHAL